MKDDVKAVERKEIESEDARSCFGKGVDVLRLRIWDEDSGKYCWFHVTAILKNHRPAVQVTAIGKKEVIKDCVGVWNDSSWYFKE